MSVTDEQALDSTVDDSQRPKETKGNEQLDGKVKRKPAWRRCLGRGLIGLALVLVVGGIVLKVSFDRIEAQASEVLQTGVSLNSFLKKYSTALADRNLDGLLNLHADDFVSANEGDWQEESMYRRDGVNVFQWRLDSELAISKADLKGQAESFWSRYSSIQKCKFKIAAIESIQDQQTTMRCVLWVRGVGMDEEKVESRVGFRMTLRDELESGVPKTSSCDPDTGWSIISRELLFGDTVRGQGKGFVNITAQSGIDFQSRHNPLLEQDQWLPEMFGIMKYASGGVCTGDYDGDGLVDVIFVDGGSTQLYRNLDGSNFEDVTEVAGLPAELHGGSVCLLADFDNDGDQDLLIGRGTGENLLFANQGDGTFHDVTEGAGVQGVWVATAAAADYDNDGLVDIYLGRYLDPRKNIPTTSFYTRNSEGNALLKNEGQLRFTDVTAKAGVRDGGLTLGTAWGDYDADGLQDLYVANDFGRNTLFRNRGDGTFEDVSEQSGTINIGYGMSSQFADIDNDGDLDIYVGALHSGQRWFGNSSTIYRYLVSAISEGTIWQDYPMYQELYRFFGDHWQDLGEETLKGNTLMLNNGDGTFSDVTSQTRVNPHGWYWSSCMFDFDNDTRQDIYTVNGWITGKTPDDL